MLAWFSRPHFVFGVRNRLVVGSFKTRVINSQEFRLTRIKILRDEIYVDWIYLKFEFISYY